ncbi:hypothetical protein ACVI53_009508 [Bradyrhizobium barranii subsp. barranii]
MVAWQIRSDRQLSGHALCPRGTNIDGVTRLWIGDDPLHDRLLGGVMRLSDDRPISKDRGLFGISWISRLKIGRALLPIHASIDVGDERVPRIRIACAGNRLRPKDIELG